jgi:hypothetical protein
MLHILKNKIINYQKALDNVTNTKEITKPLRECLGITGFCYHKIFEDNSEILLSADSHWIDTIYEKNLTVDAEFLSHENSVKKQTLQRRSLIWDTFTDIDLYAAASEHIKWYYGTTISNGNNEYYGFSMIDNQNSDITNNFMYNIDLLERFCMYFNEQAFDIIKHMSQYEGQQKSRKTIADFNLTRKALSAIG